MDDEWRPIETAPKDGTTVILAGRWRPDQDAALPGGGWCLIFARWGSFTDSSRAEREWLTDMGYARQYHADFSCWRPLPTPPDLPAEKVT